jgi:hypothetical protein
MREGAMVDLQKTGRQQKGNPAFVLVITLVIAVALGGIYLGYRLTRYFVTYNTASSAASVKGMAGLTSKQAMARVSTTELGASLFDWTSTGTSAAGLTCSVMNRGDTQTGHAWTVCGTEAAIVRVSVGPRHRTMKPRSQEAAALMTRMVEAVAPEAAAEEKQQAIAALYYLWGRRGSAIVGGAQISFSTDAQGGITRITAQPVR